MDTNLLINTRDQIADFGLARSQQGSTANNESLPIRWCAPGIATALYCLFVLEVIVSKSFSKAGDVWSFGLMNKPAATDFHSGVTVWEIAEVKRPYYQILSNRNVITQVCDEGLRLQMPTR